MASTSFQMSLLETGGFDPNSKPPISIRTIKWSLDFIWRLKPAFWWSKPSGQQLRPTAYLDGLRGFAAFMVYWQHHHQTAHESLTITFLNGFGYQDQFYFGTFPGIRSFFSGGSWAVTIFFVISGYVLTTKPLKLLHKGDYPEFLSNLSSAFFKRWLRLHLPVIATTFLYVLISRAMQPNPNYALDLLNWYNEMKNFTFIFSHGSHPFFSINPHMWTIPVEFQGSIVVFTTLVALSKATKNARLLCQLGLMIYFMYFVDGWYCSVFLAGMLLSDLDQLAANDELPGFLANKKLQRCKTFIFYSLFLISIYLGGVPSPNEDPKTLLSTPGWGYLYYLKPQPIFDYKWFYLSWAGLFAVVSIPRIPWLRRFFENRFNQYLGRISYAFYLVHGPVLWTLGERLYAATGIQKPAYDVIIPMWKNWLPLPDWGPVGLGLNFIVPHLILLPFTLWLAEIVTRFIDDPSVRFPQWLYKKTLQQTPTYMPAPTEEVP